MKTSRKSPLIECSKSVTIVLTSLTLMALLHSCTGVKRVQVPILDNVVRIDQKFVDDRSEMIMENDELPAPVYVKKVDEQYMAYLMLCTHEDCKIELSGQAFTCSCHDCQYDKDGKRLSGLAEKNLLAYKTELKDGQLIIHLDHPY